MAYKEDGAVTGTSAAPTVRFRHERIDAAPPTAKLGFCEVADITGSGRPDIIIGGRGAGYPGQRFIHLARERGLPTGRAIRSRLGFAESTLFWYENPGFNRHEVGSIPHLDVGATVGDITGDGRPDLIVGQGIRERGIYWFEPPENPRRRWHARRLSTAFEKYHDLTLADIDGDGDPELVGLSQESQVLFNYSIPDRPRKTPWPHDHLEIIDEDLHAEGLAVADLDGDGAAEIIAGPNLYARSMGSETGWQHTAIPGDWDLTRLAVGDLDHDGRPELVFSEGDSPEYGSHPGRVIIVDPRTLERRLLEDGLFCPHSLQLADVTGSGTLDIYVAEMGLGKHEGARHLLFLNNGAGKFRRETVAEGIPTHEAKLVDLTGNARLDIVGKSYGPDHHVDVWYNEGVS